MNAIILINMIFFSFFFFNVCINKSAYNVVYKERELKLTKCHVNKLK